VAVGATHVALGHLREDDRPGLSDDKKSDLSTFGGTIAMIELQCDDVALPAIYAGVRTKVLADETAILLAVPLDPRDLSADVSLAVADVVLASVSRMTDATAPLTSAS
jgi:hypothetical protein